MGSLSSNAIIQIGIVVKDIERTAQYYCKIFGLEMPNIRNCAPNVEYKGQSVTPKARLCSLKMGTVSLELVQPDETDTSWKQFMQEHGQGVHHLGIIVDDREQTMDVLAENGIFPRQFGQMKSGNYTFVESEEQLGVLLNIKYSEK